MRNEEANNQVSNAESTVSAGMSRRAFIGGAAGMAAACAAGALAATAAPALATDEAATDANEAASSADLQHDAAQDGAYAKASVTPASEQAENVKRVLVVTDYQVDFVNGGVFGTIEPAIAIEDALCASIKSYLDAGDIVIYTMDTHPEEGYELTREGQYNPLHCVPGTEGWELYGKVRDVLNPTVATMLKKSTYGSKDLPKVIQLIKDQGTQIESIEIAGVSTTCRVLHNAIMLYNFFPEAMLIMDAKTTASYTDEETYDQLKELEGWGFCIKW